jgi:hypothetical protein
MAWQAVAYVLLIASARASCSGNGCSTSEDEYALLQTKTSVSMEETSQQERYLQDKALLQTEAGAAVEKGLQEDEEMEDENEEEEEEEEQEGEEEVVRVYPDHMVQDETVVISEIQEGNSGPATGSAKSAFVKAHNAYRCMHGAGKVKWDSSIASGAYNWISAHGFQHSPQRALGENLYWSSPAPSGSSGAWKAVKNWYSEVKSCRSWPGCNGGGTGHFTAMVWKDVYKIGCAFAGKTVVCRYKAHSCGPNCGGRYGKNVKRASKSSSACGAKGGGGGGRRRKSSQSSRRRWSWGRRRKSSSSSWSYSWSR